MSHITTINLQILDLDSLEKACSRLGLELVRGKKTFKWFGRFMGDTRPPKELGDPRDYGKCDHVIRVKGSPTAYEIGLIKRKDGKGYMMAWDSWQRGHGLVDKTTYNQRQTGAEKLKDWYAAEVAKKQMSLQGFMVQTRQLNGKVQVVCSK